MISKDKVIELYIAMFQRAPSESEVDYWYNSANQNGMDVTQLADTMVEAAKNATNLFGLEELYPQYANYDPNNPDSIKAIVESVYSIIFDKDATEDPDGINYWTEQVLNGKSLGEVIVSIENVAHEIATDPNKFSDQFDPITLQQAIEAANAFQAKVQAAEDIAQNIEDVNVDPNSLKELKEIIKEVHHKDDIESIKSQIEEIKEKVESHQDMDQDMDQDNVILVEESNEILYSDSEYMNDDLGNYYNDFDGGDYNYEHDMIHG